MICLPVFERRGFMYAYVCYITASVALVLLSPKQGAFYDMAKVRSCAPCLTLSLFLLVQEALHGDIGTNSGADVTTA